MPGFDLKRVEYEQLRRDLDSLWETQVPDMLVGMRDDGRLVAVSTDAPEFTMQYMHTCAKNLAGYLKSIGLETSPHPKPLAEVERYFIDIKRRTATKVDEETCLPSVRGEMKELPAFSEALLHLHEAQDTLINSEVVKKGIYLLSFSVEQFYKSDQIDNPKSLKAAFEFITSIIQSDFYKADGSQEQLRQTIENMPDSLFKKMLLAGINIDPNQSKTDKPFDTSTFLSLAYQLDDGDRESFLKVYGESDNIQEMIIALESCQRLRQHNCQFSFLILLQGIKKYPEEAKSYIEARVSGNTIENQLAANPLLRKCLIAHAGFGDVPPEAEKYLTTENLWHNPQIFDQIEPLHEFKNLYFSLNKVNLSPEFLLFALADNQVTPELINSMSGFMSRKLRKGLTSAGKNGSAVSFVSSVVDGGNGLTPSTITISTCHELKRYLNKEMAGYESDIKKDHLEGILEAVAKKEMLTLNSMMPHYRAAIQKAAEEAFPEIGDREKREELQMLFFSWAGACQERRGEEHLLSYKVELQADLKKLQRQFAMVFLQPLSSELKQLEPLIEASRTLEKFKESIEQGLSFQKPERMKFISTQLEGYALIPGQRTIANPHCGFSAIAMMTGDSPDEVRTKIAKAAEDIQIVMDSGDSSKITGDKNYRERVRIAAQNQFYVNTGFLPKDRAKFVKAALQEAQQDKSPQNYWLNPEDICFAAVAYNAPVFLFTPAGPDQKQLGCLFSTAEGDFVECCSVDDFEECKQLAQMGGALALVNVGHPFNSSLVDHHFYSWQPATCFIRAATVRSVEFWQK